MLLQFLVENYRSFHKETILNMAPARSRIHPDHILQSKGKGRTAKALPLAVFYGANASGKSNLIRAIDFARSLVLEGTRGESPIGAAPFLLSSDSINKPSRFEFVLKQDNVLYTFGFAVTHTEVKEEWLFGHFNKKEVRLYERVKKDGKDYFEFGNKFASSQIEKDRLQHVASGTRPNQLFLTESFERNVELLKPLIHWFRDHLIIILPDAKYSPLVLRAHDDKQFEAFLLDFLKIADTGIQGINLVSSNFDINKLKMPDSFKNSIIDKLETSPEHSIEFPSEDKEFIALRKEQDNTIKLMSMQTTHKTIDGRNVNFDTSNESDGTHRMMHLAPALLDLQTSENVYIIDELDRSMHPLLCRLFIEAFLRGIESNNARGQMILTTHQTCLLDLNLLRRDEIWFVEKDVEGSSHLTSLAEFKSMVRADLKISKGYLNGRFGAIPFLGDVRLLIKKRAAK